MLPVYIHSISLHLSKIVPRKSCTIYVSPLFSINSHFELRIAFDKSIVQQKVFIREGEMKEREMREREREREMRERERDER